MEKTIDELKAGIGRPVESTPATPTMAKLHKVKLRKVPQVKFLPAMARSTEAIDPKIRVAIRELLVSSEPRWPLFLHGSVGCGKTCAALCIADLVASTIYRSIRELSDEVLSARDGRLFREGHPSEGMLRVTEAVVWKAIDTAPLVIIDELGNRQSGDFEYECLKRILDKRVCRPTVCLSNHSPEELGKFYDFRIVDRLKGGTVLHYPGTSRRGQG